MCVCVCLSCIIIIQQPVVVQGLYSLTVFCKSGKLYLLLISHKSSSINSLNLINLCFKWYFQKLSLGVYLHKLYFYQILIGKDV